MESLQAARCCVRRGITPHNTQLHSHLTPSRALRHPHGRRKTLGASTSTRLLSTSPSQLQEETPSSPPSQSQTQSPKPSTDPRPSQWTNLFQAQRPHGTPPTPPSRDRAALQQQLDAKVDVLDLVQPRQRGSSIDMMHRVRDGLRIIDAKNTHDSLAAIHLRLTPMLGRTIGVEPGSGSLDLQSAFRILEIRCAANNLKNDSIRQRTHVRRGQAKKELRSKRWRAMFKEGFLRELGRVRRMKGQGW